MKKVRSDAEIQAEKVQKENALRKHGEAFERYQKLRSQGITVNQITTSAVNLLYVKTLLLKKAGITDNMVEGMAEGMMNRVILKSLNLPTSQWSEKSGKEIPASPTAETMHAFKSLVLSDNGKSVIAEAMEKSGRTRAPKITEDLTLDLLAGL